MLKQIGNYLESKWSVRLIAVFYFFAGINHFISPQFYLPLIPPFFPYPEAINSLSGIIEVALGLGMLFVQSRKIASYGIILLLLAFIPSHVYFIQIGSCISEGLCVPAWVGWVRLIVIHPILILWAWKAGKSSF